MASNQIQSERIVLMVNLDMIGRNPGQPVQVMGSASALEVQRLVETANREEQLPLRFSVGPDAAISDYDPFHRQGIPFLFFFTGIHEDYHGTDDEADRLSYPRLAEVVKLAADTVVLAAMMSRSPAAEVYVDWLGMTVNTDDGAEPRTERVRAVVTSVKPGSAAERAGLREGDMLLAAAGRVPRAAQELRQVFEAVGPGRALSMTVKRGEQDLEFRLNRPPAGYLGVMIAGVEEEWRLSNDLEAKSGVLIRRVLENGPAGLEAGLEAGDVLLAVDGIPVGPMNLRALLTKIGAGVRVDLTVFRKGKRITVPLTLGRRP
jgi:predicted metalloprotease with PDZ domain